MSNARLAVLAVVSFLASCATPTHIYDGPKRSDSEVSIYSRFNYDAFLSGIQIYTIELDGKNVEANPPEMKGLVGILPGTHKARIGFVDYQNYLFPATIRSNVFKGWYEIEFKTKPGYLYAPIFNLNREGKERFNEMCIAEVLQKDDLQATRKPMTYAVCAAATIPITAENFVQCNAGMIGHGEGCGHWR